MDDTHKYIGNPCHGGGTAPEAGGTGGKKDPPLLLKMTIDFTPLKLYSTKPSGPFIGDERSFFMKRARISPLQNVYFRFTKVRYAGRFERGEKTSG